MNRSAPIAATELASPRMKAMASSSGMLCGLRGAKAMTRKARAVTPTPMAYHLRAERVVSIRGDHSTFQVLGNRFIERNRASSGTPTPLWCSR